MVVPQSSDTTASIKFKGKKTGQTGNDRKKNAELMMPSKYFIYFWRILKMPLLNCEIYILLTFSANCYII